MSKQFEVNVLRCFFFPENTAYISSEDMQNYREMLQKKKITKKKKNYRETCHNRDMMRSALTFFFFV
jgi:hypothetical protein